MRGARAAHQPPEVASAFREGRITLLQAEAVLRGRDLGTTLCASHHFRGVHAGLLRIRGRASEGLVYELGVGTLRSRELWCPGRGTTETQQLPRVRLRMVA